jgi:hypothetical protein
LSGFPSEDRLAETLAASGLCRHVSLRVSGVNLSGGRWLVRLGLALHFLDLSLLGSGGFGALLFHHGHLLLLRGLLCGGLLGGLLLGSLLRCRLLLGGLLHLLLLLLRGLLLLLARAFASASSEPS